MASIKTIPNQALALAGVFQSVHLCKSLATTGRCDADDLSATLASILTMDSDQVVDAYGGSPAGIRRGLRLLKSQFGGLDQARDLDLSRYALSLVQLSANVMADRSTLDALTKGIARAQSLELDITDNIMINNLAELYSNCISHLSPRIMVSGSPEFLNDDKVAASIRASLLGGLRSVVLWKQCGGSRPKLVFARTSYVHAANEWLGA